MEEKSPESRKILDRILARAAAYILSDHELYADPSGWIVAWDGKRGTVIARFNNVEIFWTEKIEDLKLYLDDLHSPRLGRIMYVTAEDTEDPLEGFER